MRLFINSLTFSRFFGGAFIPFLIFYQVDRFTIFLIYLILSLTDIVDGYLSRKFEKSFSGDILDWTADKFLFLGSIIAISFYESIPKIPLIFITLREIGVLGLRGLAERERIVIKSTWEGKIKTLFENISFMAFTLSYVNIESINLNGETVGKISIWIAFILSTISGVKYIINYMKQKNKTEK